MTTEPSSVIGIKLGHPSIHWINVFGLSVSIHLRLVILGLSYHYIRFML